MAKKINCNKCHSIHGGFHLCLGVVELPVRKNQNFNRTMEEKTQAYRERIVKERKARQAEMAHLRASGMSFRDIAAKYNISHVRVRTLVKNHYDELEEENGKRSEDAAYAGSASHD